MQAKYGVLGMTIHKFENVTQYLFQNINSRKYSGRMQTRKVRGLVTYHRYSVPGSGEVLSGQTVSIPFGSQKHVFPEMIQRALSGTQLSGSYISSKWK